MTPRSGGTRPRGKANATRRDGPDSVTRPRAQRSAHDSGRRPGASAQAPERRAVARLVGQRIRELRYRAGLSQADLGGERYTAFAISKIENGSSLPSLEMLLYVASRFGCRVRELFPADL